MDNLGIICDEVIESYKKDAKSYDETKTVPADFMKKI